MMRERLEKEIERHWRGMTEKNANDNVPNQEEEEERVIVAVSERDRDPYGIVILEGTAVEGVKI